MGDNKVYRVINTVITAAGLLACLASGFIPAPEGLLAEKIKEEFGSFETFKEKITGLALGQFGSGWAWLSVKPDGGLVLSNTPNQDNPISLGTGNTPIFTIDVWEHAYYLKYRNLRPDYVKAFFDIVDWKAVEENYKNALSANDK